MAFYVIGIRNKTKNADEMKEYARRAPEARRPSMKLHVRYGAFEVLEGAPIEGAVIIEFPTKEEALAWYTSPLYKEIREHRFKGADYQMILIEGV
jgi:uncharacterized protein (DUF1330 family)